MNDNNNKNGVLMIILLGLVGITVLFFPKLYELVSNLSMPKVEQVKKEEKEEKKEVDDSILETPPQRRPAPVPPEAEATSDGP